MTSLKLAMLGALSLLIISCQSAPPRVDGWKYVGDGDSDVMEVAKECQRRADDDFNSNTDMDFYSVADAGVLLLALPIIYNIKSDKYFTECMNGRNYANNEDDIKHLRDDNNERIVAQNRSKVEEKVAEEARTIKVGDYVSAKFDVLVVYESTSPDSAKLGRFQSNEKAKILSVEDEWVYVSIRNISGWARMVSIRRSPPPN